MADSGGIGAFLRARREHLRPGDVGLTAVTGERRRTPGLRREEVALLCGVSATWYTWLEQGRDISVSPEALARLATTLRLTRAERAYLFGLARKRDPRTGSTDVAATLPHALAAFLKITTVPAYCLDRFWQACGWNLAAAHLFAGWLGGPELNLMRYMFLDPTARILVGDWPERARRLVAEFRADAVPLAETAAHVAFVADLASRSAVFAALWREQAVQAREGGLRGFNHPIDGALRFEQITLLPPSHDGFKLVVLMPAGPATIESPR